MSATPGFAPRRRYPAPGFVFWRALRWVPWLTLLWAVGAAAAQPETVRVGVLHHRGAEVARRMWEPTVRYLEQQVAGYRFELVPLSYDELSPAVARRAVDFTVTAAGLYVELELRHGVTRIATVMSSGPKGDFSEYGGVLVARADRDDIRTIYDLKDKTLLIPNRLSFGGWQMQWRELKAAGLRPDVDFTVREAGDNEKTLLGVVAGTADVAAARSDVIERMVQEGKLTDGAFRLVTTPAAPLAYPYLVSTRLYPDWPFSKLRHTPDALARKVAVALLTMPRDSAAAKAAEIVGWTVPKDYGTVHELFRELRLGPYARSAFTARDVLDRYWIWGLAGALALAGILLATTLRIAAANRRLAEEKGRTETYLDIVGTIVVVLDGEARLVRANRSALEVLGYAESDLLGRNWFDAVIPASQRRDVEGVFRGVVNGEMEFGPSFENEVVTARGETRRIRWNNRVLRNERGQGTSVISAGEDVTDQRRAEAQLRLYANVFETSAEGVLICDAAGDIVAVNPAFSEITGFAAREVVGRNPRMLSSGRQDGEFFRGMWYELARFGRWRGEIWNRRKDGSVYPEALSITVLRDAEGRATHYIGIFSDISREKEDQARINFLAYYDPLTRLPNRTLLADRFVYASAFARRNGRQLAVMFIDLDRFKQVNDTLGHAIGDDLLRAVGERFGTCMRESDTLARLGGDEFIVLLTDLHSPADAGLVAGKCLDALSTPIMLGSHELRITPSIGIAICPEDGSSLDDLIKNADMAMYSAKDGGRNTYQFYTGAMTARICERAQLEKELGQGIDRNEFVLHYQPQVAIATGRIVGVEALVRWQHPQRGLVMPDQFIPIAEESGLVVPLGQWIVREACRQNAAWQAAGIPAVRVAVNVSGEQLRKDGFDDVIRGALAQSGMAAQWLELELTESLLIRDIERNLRLLADLKGLGVHLAVDDFGTGYSSLSYLKRFPVDRLKIDRSFVHDLASDSDDRAIAATVIAMGHRLGLKVVAEGVETQQHLAFLRDEGCDECQGYLFGRPLPPDAVARLLEPGIAEHACPPHPIFEVERA